SDVCSSDLLSWSWMSLLVGRVCPGTRSWTTKRVGRGVAPQPTRCAVDDAFAPGRRVLDRGCSAEQTAGEKEIQVLHDHGAAAALAQLEDRVLTTAADLVHEAPAATGQSSADDDQQRDRSPAGLLTLGLRVGHQLLDQEHTSPDQADRAQEHEQQAAPVLDRGLRVLQEVAHTPLGF